MLAVGKWAIGVDRANGDTLLRFEFTDHETIELRLPQDHAEHIANAILAQYESPPPPKSN